MSEAKDDAVLERRLAGKSARAIGRELKLTVGQVDEALDRVLGTVSNETRRRALVLDLHRLDQLLQVFLKKAIEQGDHNSGLLTVKILERRAYALGIDQPVKLDVITMRAQEGPKSFERIRAAVYKVARGSPPPDGPQPADGDGSAEPH
jgi:hypothetical protein